MSLSLGIKGHARKQGVGLPYLPPGFAFVVDSNGNYYVDSAGNYYIVGL